MTKNKSEKRNDFLLPESIGKNQKTICPHCWHKFFPDEALYISSHPHYKGKGKLGGNEFARFSPESIKTNSSTGKKTDPMGSEIYGRACPICELDIPLELQKKRPIIISLAGLPRSGKTYFLTTLLHKLKEQLPKYFDTSFIYSDSPYVKAFTKLEDQLFSTRSDSFTYLEKTSLHGVVNSLVEMNGMKIQLPKPFLFSLKTSNLKANNNYQNFAFYDNAGEYYSMGREHDATLKIVDHLEVADAIIFAFDPLQEEKVQSELIKTSSDLELKYLYEKRIIHDQAKVLQAVISKAKILRNKIGEKLNIPLLVCLQKFDVWKSKLPKWVNFTRTTSIRTDKNGRNGIAMSEINDNSILIRKYLSEINPSFVQLAEQEFSYIRFFPISSLGSKLVLNDKNILGISPKDINPYRVTDPLLWLMAKYNLLPILKNQKSKNNKDSLLKNFKSFFIDKNANLNLTLEKLGKVFNPSPTSKPIQPLNTDLKTAILLNKTLNRITIKLPESGKIMELDLDYCDTIITDPWLGKKTRIP